MDKGSHGRKDRLIKEKLHNTYREGDKSLGPTVCKECGVLYISGRWSWEEAPAQAGQTICPACEAEVEALNQIHRKYGGQVEVISVFIAESERKVSRFVDDKKITYTILLDMDQAVARRYSILGIPLNLIIDKNGRIVFKEHYLPHNIERYLHS